MALGDLVSFVRVMEAGSVSAASRSLGVPRPTLSRRISRLEDHYGVRLVHRSTRSLTLTDAGQEVFQNGRAIVADLDALDATVRSRDGAVCGLVRVSGPVNGSDGTNELYASFLRKYPEVQLEVKATSRRVDLVAERIDVAIRGGHVGDEALIGRRVRNSRSSLVASAAYLDERGTPTQVSDLIDHDLLLGFGGTEQAVRQWPFLDGGQFSVKGRMACNNMSTLVHLIHGDMGIALVPEFIVKPALEAGMVRRVLEDEVGSEGGLYILYVDRRYQQPQVRAFVDHATEWMTTMTLPPVCPERDCQR